MIIDLSQGTFEEQRELWRKMEPPKHWLAALSEQYAADWPAPEPEPMSEEEAERIG